MNQEVLRQKLTKLRDMGFKMSVIAERLNISNTTIHAFLKGTKNLYPDATANLIKVLYDIKYEINDIVNK